MEFINFADDFPLAIFLAVNLKISCANENMN